MLLFTITIISSMTNSMVSRDIAPGGTLVVVNISSFIDLLSNKMNSENTYTGKASNVPSSTDPNLIANCTPCSSSFTNNSLHTGKVYLGMGRRKQLILMADHLTITI